MLCVHGGLSPDLRTIDQMRTIKRTQEIPHFGPFCDLMWSDPEDIESWATSPRYAQVSFLHFCVIAFCVAAFIVLFIVLYRYVLCYVMLSLRAVNCLLIVALASSLVLE